MISKSDGKKKGTFTIIVKNNCYIYIRLSFFDVARIQFWGPPGWLAEVGNKSPNQLYWKIEREFGAETL